MLSALRMSPRARDSELRIINAFKFTDHSRYAQQTSTWKVNDVSINYCLSQLHVCLFLPWYFIPAEKGQDNSMVVTDPPLPLSRFSVGAWETQGLGWLTHNLWGTSIQSCSSCMLHTESVYGCSGRVNLALGIVSFYYAMPVQSHRLMYTCHCFMEYTHWVAGTKACKAMFGW